MLDVWALPIASIKAVGSIAIMALGISEDKKGGHQTCLLAVFGRPTVFAVFVYLLVFTGGDPMLFGWCLVSIVVLGV